MIEYRQYVPEDKTADPSFVSQVTMDVCSELSRQASATGDPEEFFVRALKNITKRDSRNGGIWIHGFLEQPRRAEYLEPSFDHLVSDLPLAKIHEPVDFTEEELAEHLAKKRGVHHVS